jgi:adenylate kinase
MRLLLLAAPGAGKGTQAARLSRHFGIPIIATGDMLRHAVETGSPLGLRAREDVERGDLVPDEIIMELVLKRLTEVEAAGGWILDGFPRNLHQAMLAEHEGIVPDRAIYLRVSEEVAIQRMLSRSADQRRRDDVEATIRHRIEVFQRQTYPLCRFYAERGLLIDIDAEQPPDQVTAAILDKLAEVTR